MEGNKSKVCQCPKRGALHFYDLTYITNSYHVNCVNALKEATFISTLASGNPHK